MNLSQLVMDSTHVKGNILDLVLTNAENFIYDLFIADSLPLIPSDHLTVSLKIKYALPPSQRTSHNLIIPRLISTVCVITYLTLILETALIQMMWNMCGLTLNLLF